MADHYPDIDALTSRLPALRETDAVLRGATAAILETLRSGGTVFACGNGGSACDAEHMVGELVKSFELPRPVPAALRGELERRYGDAGSDLANRLQTGLRAVSLVSSVGAATAIANDQGADLVYAQQLLALARPGDLLVGFSTSGTSANVVAALRLAAALDVRTVLLTGRRYPGGSPPAAEHVIVAPDTATAPVQEYHLAIYHAICMAVERALFE